MESVNGVKGFSGGWQEIRDLLRQWREDNTRKSLQTVQLGNCLLKDHSSSLGDEVWLVYEQVFVSALDCGDMETAQMCYEALSSQFPASVHVQRLNGMMLEGQEKYEEAEQYYTDMLEQHPTSVEMWKRKVAVLKAQGKISLATQELTKLLEVFMSDTESWLELGDLYISLNDYPKAAFCLEELILTNPHHHLYHQRYAEVCYTMASLDSMELARKHFATAVKLNPENLRALYGFCWVSHTLGSRSGKGEVKTRNTRYVDWATTQLKHLYQFDSEKLRIVERMLDSIR